MPCANAFYVKDLFSVSTLAFLSSIFNPVPLVCGSELGQFPILLYPWGTFGNI